MRLSNVDNEEQGKSDTGGSNAAIAIRAEHVQLSFATSSVLNDISLEVFQGESVAIVGPSGCGKTTFLNILAGLQKVTSGTVSVNGSLPKAGREEIGYAPARDALLPWRNARDNVAFALQVQGVPGPIRRQRADKALESVGLKGHEEKHRSQLSQGMRQRVSLARTFVRNPSLLLLDEPFAALDPQTRISMQGVLLSLLKAFSGTMVLVTHDIPEAIVLADRIVLLSGRPAIVKETFRVPIERPRDPVAIRKHPAYLELFDKIWYGIGSVETDERSLKLDISNSDEEWISTRIAHDSGTTPKSSVVDRKKV